MSKVPSIGMGLVSQERYRQIVDKEYDAEHDAQWTEGELTGAAATIATCVMGRSAGGLSQADLLKVISIVWPLRWEYDVLDTLDLKTTDGQIIALSKAGALIVAEIDRLLRDRDTIQVEGGD